MGHQFPLSTALSIRCPPPGHGQGAGYHLPGDFDPPDPLGRTTTQGWRDRGSNSDPALRIRSQPKSERGPIHFHILFLDGIYVYRDSRAPRFQRVKAPDKSELQDLVQLISQRVGRSLERQGLLEQDAESAWLDLEPAEDTNAMPHILGSSVAYRVAVGPQQGRKAFMIRTIWPLDSPDPSLEWVANANGFSLHAGVSCEGHQKDKRERLAGTPLAPR